MAYYGIPTHAARSEPADGNGGAAQDRDVFWNDDDDDSQKIRGPEITRDQQRRSLRQRMHNRCLRLGARNRREAGAAASGFAPMPSAAERSKLGLERTLGFGLASLGLR